MMQVYQRRMDEPRWLLLVHQLPPHPAYVRVKVGRRLAAIGAVALKSTVYVLPSAPAAQEDFQWLRREIVGAGGDATLLEARLVEGIDDEGVEALFRAARDADYGAWLEDARAVLERLDEAADPTGLEASVSRLERRLEEIVRIDFFDAPERVTAEATLVSLRSRLAVEADEGTPIASRQGCTWVTRTGVHVDRIASAWLIARFVDPDATFKFVPARGYVPSPGELRFDMFDAEYTHEGDACTFEVLLARFGLTEGARRRGLPAATARGLGAIAELVHDLDLKDAKFGRDEAAGLGAQIVGIAAMAREDEARLALGFPVFDALLAYFARRR